MRRAGLSAEIQTSMGPAPVDPSVVHDQADPGAGDRGVAEIDILPNQTLRALAACVNQPLACAGGPVEQQIDALSFYPRFGSPLFPLIRGIARHGGVRAPVPAARPAPFHRAVSAAVISAFPGLRIIVVVGSLQCRTSGELSHLLVIGIGNIHDTEWISNSAGFALRFHVVLQLHGNVRYAEA